MRDGKVIEAPIQPDGLSQRLVDQSRRFIAKHAHSERPFFLFHSFPHVHTPMFSAAHMAGKSKHGRFGVDTCADIVLSQQLNTFNSISWHIYILLFQVLMIRL